MPCRGGSYSRGLHATVTTEPSWPEIISELLDAPVEPRWTVGRIASAAQLLGGDIDRFVLYRLLHGDLPEPRHSGGVALEKLLAETRQRLACCASAHNAG